MGFEQGATLTHDRADELKSELGGYDDDMLLFDGVAVGTAIVRLREAPKTLGEPVVLYSGAESAAQRGAFEAQPELF